MAFLPFGYESVYDIRFYDCDCNGQMKLSAVLRYLSDIAERHYDGKGFGHDFLWENKMAFLLAGESVRFHRRPHGNEKLTFTTWEKAIKGARYLRDFEVFDEDGNLVISATSVWLLANPLTRQILRPNVYDFKVDCHPERAAETLPVEKPKSYGTLLPLEKRCVRFSDLDNNLHVYNANYADMALDALSGEEAGGSVSDFRIHYVSEARPGDKISLFRADLPGQGLLIQGEKEDNSTCFIFELWR